MDSRKKLQSSEGETKQISSSQVTTMKKDLSLLALGCGMPLAAACSPTRAALITHLYETILSIQGAVAKSLSLR
jgi:hypothetical protein